MSRKYRILLLLVVITCLVLAGCKKKVEGSEGAKGRTWRFKYNDSGQLAEVSRPDNQKIEYRYDERGTLDSVKYGKQESRFAYNRLGYLTRLEDHTGVTRMKRDPFGRLKEMVYPGGDRLNYDYYEDGDILKVAWGDRHFLKFFRDLLGRTIRLETPAGAFTMLHDYNKRFKQRTYPNGAFSQFHYNRDGRPVRIQHALPDGRLVFDFHYTYNDAGFLASIRETSMKGESTIQYTYDEYGQLLKAEYSDGRTYTYEYDAFGNRVKHASPAGTFHAAYDSRDRMVTWQGEKAAHDAAGNIAALGDSTFVFDANDALVSDGKKNYRYNGLGLRVQAVGKEESSDFIHFIDDLAYVLAEKGTKEKRYLWNEGRCLGQIEGDNRVLFFFEDHLGSIRCAVDGSGHIVGLAEYSPFGMPIARIPGVRFGYAGEEQDEGGRVYLRSRYYEPRIGRFLSRDSVGVQLLSSLKQNRYAYAANSPVNYTDKNGAYPDPLNQWLWEQQIRMQRLRDQQLKQQDFFTQPQSQPRQYYEKVLIGGFGSDPQEYSKYKKENGGPFDLVITLGTGSFAGDLMHSVPDYLGMSSPHSSDTFDQYKDSRFGLVVAHSWAPMAFESYMRNNPGSIQVDKVIYLGAPKSYSNDLTLGKKYVNVGDPVSMIPELTAESRSDMTGLNREDFIGIKWTFRFGPGNPDKKVYPSSPGLKAHSLDDYLSKPEVKQEIESFRSSDDSRKQGFLPPNPPPDGGGGGGMFDSPNVGGVYLDRAAEVVGSLGGVEGVTFDPLSNRVLLIGSDRAKTGLAGVRLDDLAAAFRSVFGDYDTEPGVTIDPDPKNPRAEKMIVRFFGGMENSHFGQVLFEADRLMKALSLGTDNISGKKVGAAVKDYYNLLDLAYSNLAGKYNKNLWSRFWLVPERVIVRVSDDKKSITFPDTRIRVKTETMRWQGGKLVPAKGQKDETAEYFAAHFSRYYDEFAKEFPVYRELKDLANLVGLAKWLKESGAAVDFSWLKKYDKPFKTPETTPSLTVRDERQVPGGSRVVSIFGGTDLTVKGRYVKDDGKSAAYGRNALSRVVAQPGIASGTFMGEDKSLKRVVALPTSQTRAGGAKVIKEHELGLIARTFCSFHNDPGPFGRSWAIDIPRLSFSQPHRGKKEYTGVGTTRVQVRKFHFTRPFGLLDLWFEKYEVDQQSGTIAFLPERRVGIRALYPDDKKGEFRVAYDDGSFELFDTRGRLVRSERASGHYREYAYDQSSRLKKVTAAENGKAVDHVILAYDSQGRVSAAETLADKILYTYDSTGNLAKVKTRKDTIEYTYDERHLLTGVQINGKVAAEFAYDAFGRLLVQKEGGDQVKREIKSLADRVEITESANGKENRWIYDTGGRLLEGHSHSCDRVKIDYYELGAPKRIEYTDCLGETARIEYSPDQRQVRYTDAEGHVRLFLYDEFNKLKQIQDDKYALLTKEYGMTDRGWMEETRTAEKTAQTFFDRAKRPIDFLLTSNVPGGGQIQVKDDYNRDGTMRRKRISGLFDELLMYESGMLKQLDSGGEAARFQYDAEGRLKEMIAANYRVSYTYGKEGDVTSVKVQKGKKRESYLYSNGRLSSRESTSGRNDAFRYDEAGRLVNVQKGSRENWQIEHNGSKMTILRNGQEYLEVVFDDKGRLVQILE